MPIRRETTWILSELVRIEAESRTDLFGDAAIIETDGGVLIFLPDQLRLRGILREWAQALIEDIYSRAGHKLDPDNLIKRATGEKATSEEAAEIENEVKKEFADKVFSHSLKLWHKHLPQGLDDAVFELLELVHLRAYLDWMGEEDAQTSSEAHYFDQLLKTINGRIKKRFQKRGRGGSKPRIEDRSSISSRYVSLYLKVKVIKKYHDSERELFEKNNQGRGFNDDRWREHWLAYARDRFHDEDVEFLGLFAAPDKYESSAAGIAYKQLARETGYGVEYVKKLVGSSRRRSPKRTVKPTD